MNNTPHAWYSAISDYLVYLEAAGRPESTRKLRRSQLARLARAVQAGPWQVSTDNLTGWIAGQHWDSQTIRSHRAAVVGFYRWGVATRRTETDPAAGLPSVPGRRGHPRPAAAAVIQAALGAAEPRDALMIRLAAEAGLRACEVARVHTRDMTQDAEGPLLIVRGKGDRTRLVPLTGALAATLATLPAGYVFPGQIDGHLSAAYVSKRMSWALGPGVTGHQLRHAFASAAYAVDRDLRAVQELLGHASVATTQVYTAVPASSLRRAVAGAAA